MGRELDLKSKLLTGMIWEGWAAVYLFLQMLEFWRILSLRIFKITHDEFLYDESLNSYHSHIYMLARLWATHLLEDRSLTHAASTPEVRVHIYPPISISRATQKYSTPNPGENSQKHSPIPVFPCEINSQVILVTTTCYYFKRWVF